MRTIKFRGRDIKSSEIVYGNLVYDAVGKPFVVRYKSKSEFELSHIDPDSVAQLVGYDSNGNEVYEGDILVDRVGTEYIARLEPYIATADKKYYTLALKGGDINDRRI